MPLINQTKLAGVLYLENNLAPSVFAPSRIAVLKLLASQAAIALENTRLYRDLAEREAKIWRLVDANIIGIFIWDFDGRISRPMTHFSACWDSIVRISLLAEYAGWIRRHWIGAIASARALEEVATTGLAFPYEKEYFRKNGSRVPVLIGLASLEEGKTRRRFRCRFD